MGKEKRLRMSETEISLIYEALENYQKVTGYGNTGINTLMRRFYALEHGYAVRSWGRVRDKKEEVEA